MLNILNQPLIQYEDPAGARTLATLPAIYAALIADRITAFPALRPHQRHAWHAFLVQLAETALRQAGVDTIPTDAAEWALLLRKLTADHPDDAPWQLLVDDITKPAFMQPPASSPDRLSDYRKTAHAPDELDLPITAKNHDLKSATAFHAAPEDWIFALISLQTMEGYGGRNNYGISRMPSGYGNRSAFSFTPALGPGAHLRRDLEVLRAAKPPDRRGIALLWTVPWDGGKAETLPLDALDPGYIEVCRRVRLRQPAGVTTALRAPSAARRIVDAKGLVDDPWMPVSAGANPGGTPPAFLGARKFSYERAVDGLVSPNWQRPTLLRPTATEQTGYLLARGMVRGEGGTAGYHERVIPLRQRLLQELGDPAGVQAVGDLARARIEQIGRVRRALRFGVAVYAAAGQTEGISEEHRSRANPWANRLNETVDADFFAALQTELELPEELQPEARRSWLLNGRDGVVDQANRLLLEAMRELPIPTMQRYKARVKAENSFWGSLHGSNGLPDIFPTRANRDPAEAAAPQPRQPSDHRIPDDFAQIVTDLAEAAHRTQPDAGSPPDADPARWELIRRGMAIMSQGPGPAHRPNIAVGQAMYQGSWKSSPLYSEAQLATLLAARGPTLHRLLEQLFRTLANAGCAFDWREMAWFIHNAESRPTAAEQSRRHIARSYYQAERRDART